MVNGVYEVESDFVNNLRLYIINFDFVTFACPVAPTGNDSGILRSIPFNEIQNNKRLSYIPLPQPHNEFDYFLHYRATRKLLKAQIIGADYLLFSPYAMFDWPTLAAMLAVNMKRKFDVESDLDQDSVSRLTLAGTRAGIKKLRRTVLTYLYLKRLDFCMAKSSIALLQGQDVFDAYKNRAPNPYKVLNVQVCQEDHIPFAQLREKLTSIMENKPLQISYAGRVIDRKGPFDWLKAIDRALQAGANLRATWLGDGSLMSEIRREVERLGIGERVSFPGVVNRDAIMTTLRATDIFLFCHKTRESPRCLSEALSSGCALVGYRSPYSEELVSPYGGGEFADVGAWQGLGDIIIALDRNRVALSALVEGAASSGRLLDRDAYMQTRIDLIKKHLS
jgi:glycosyltransferase involved in cell wall biosynthesis